MYPPSQSKFLSLQILRALAAWTVVFHHIALLYAIEAKSLIGTFFLKYGPVGVDVFFVLSGFVMYLAAGNSRKGAGPFFVDRLFRVAPVYWFYSVLVIVGIWLMPRGFAYTAYDSSSLIASALFIPHLNPSGVGEFPLLVVGWTLNFEMFFYASLACCMALSPKHFFKLLFAAFAILPLVYPKGIFFSYIASSMKLYEFLAGALLAACWVGSIGDAARRFKGALILAALAGVGVGAAILAKGQPALPVALAIVSLALLCEDLLRQNSFAVRSLVQLGNESYSTYLVHCVVIGAAIHLGGKELSQSRLIGTSLAIILATYLFSAASYRWVERNGRMDALRAAINRRVAGNSLQSTSAAKAV